MVLHEGDEIHVEDFEQLLERHKEQKGKIDGGTRIDLVVHETDAPELENEVYGPEEDRRA